FKIINDIYPNHKSQQKKHCKTGINGKEDNKRQGCHRYFEWYRGQLLFSGFSTKKEISFSLILNIRFVVIVIVESVNQKVKRKSNKYKTGPENRVLPKISFQTKRDQVNPDGWEP